MLAPSRYERTGPPAGSILVLLQSFISPPYPILRHLPTHEAEREPSGPLPYMRTSQLLSRYDNRLIAFVELDALRVA